MGRGISIAQVVGENSVAKATSAKDTLREILVAGDAAFNGDVRNWRVLGLEGLCDCADLRVEDQGMRQWANSEGGIRISIINSISISISISLLAGLEIHKRLAAM
jgi:hypothetical protein